jgi:hypothetical protein
MQCPKCSYVRKPTDAAPDYECPSCGVIYSKYNPEAERKLAEIRSRNQQLSVDKAAVSAKPWRPFDLHPLLLLSMLGGVFVIAWIFGSLKASSPKPRQIETPPAITQDQRNGAQISIKLAGYRCDDISFMGQLAFKNGFRVTCNADRYVYEFVDEGGRWVVHLN